MIPSTLRRLVRKPFSLALVGVLAAIVVVGGAALLASEDFRTYVGVSTPGTLSGAAGPTPTAASKPVATPTTVAALKTAATPTAVAASKPIATPTAVATATTARTVAPTATPVRTPTRVAAATATPAATPGPQTINGIGNFTIYVQPPTTVQSGGIKTLTECWVGTGPSIWVESMTARAYGGEASGNVTLHAELGVAYWDLGQDTYYDVFCRRESRDANDRVTDANRTSTRYPVHIRGESN